MARNRNTALQAQGFRPFMPGAPIPRGGASGLAYQRQHAMGASPSAAAQPSPPATDYQPGGIETTDPWKDWTQIPAYYTVTLNIPTNTINVGDAQSTPLRPEPFVLKRITFASQEDAVGFGLCLASIFGRLTEVSWQDEFTKFLGEQPCLVSALFGDSEGFLDLGAGILFQGRQSLTVKMNRIGVNPLFAQTPQTLRCDVNFQGIALLPPGEQSSGSVR